MKEQNQQLKIWGGLGILYFVWGSTYLAIRFMVQSFPPVMGSGIRNMCAGTILFIWAILTKKYTKPSKKHLLTMTLTGTLMITLGNGFFTIAGKWIPSSYAALFSALGPVVLVLMLWFSNIEKPQPKVILGSLLGIVGVGILISLKKLALKGYEQYYMYGVVLMFIATIAFNASMVILKKAKLPYSTPQVSGIQMMIGGGLSLIISFFLGDFQHFAQIEVTSTAIFALLYLIVIGSIVAFNVFNWLIKVAPPTLVSTYTYVNPLVAMLLGWLLAGEELHPLMIVAGGIIVTAVALITTSKRK
ncbi:EamA family transporter [Flectobacillus longus]|uniref:EamA family transporter n=1 Tax=Flectobacillus longus TaxID=2984207 RepID=UPI0024B74C63|nr:EamA family transporter [Flectobacillus longus]MDI9879836.1 EamA family transporter [Flectobacillus longus]